MKKKFISIILAGVLAVTMMAGCVSNEVPQADNKNTVVTETAEKTSVRVAFWGQNMLYGVAPALREAFPNVDFEFIVAHNNTDYYEYLSENDDLPDIITIRRFSLLDAVNLKDTLVDLSTTDIAASYYQNYLQNYTFEDGTINWLPAVAEVQSIIANKSLFECYEIKIPTDYKSFVSACEQFEKLGIIPFANQWNNDFGCLEVLEGINAELLQSKDGRVWREAYESGTVSGLDNIIWPKAFEKMESFLKDTKSLGSEYRDMSVFDDQAFLSIQDGMDQGYIAMLRNGGSDVAGYNERNEDEYIMLPYFGDTEDDNWILTYPYYQAAVNSKSSVDSKLLMEIFEFILSQKGQEALGIGNNMMSYSKDVVMDINEGMKSLDSYLDSNKVFIRLANNKFFSTSYDIVGQMMTGELDAKSAYKAFDEQLSTPDEEPKNDITFKKGYEWEFDEKHGSKASSAILNTLRTSWDTDLAVCYASSISNSIYEGTASSDELQYKFAGNFSSEAAVFELTGAEVTALIKSMVEGWECEVDEQYGYKTETALVPHENNGLPVSSGFEMQITRNGTDYKLDGLTVNGKPINDNTTYKIAICIPFLALENTVNSAGIDVERGDREAVPYILDTFTDWMTSNKQLIEPTDYIVLK